MRNELDHEPGRAREKRGMARRDVGFLGRSGGSGQSAGPEKVFGSVNAGERRSAAHPGEAGTKRTGPRSG